MGTSPGKVGGSRWEELVRRCAQADQGALAELYDQSSQLVYGVALRVLSNQADAEEVTIDVYNQVWRTAAGFEQTRGSVTAWLVMLARSRAIDRVRARSTRDKREDWSVRASCGAVEANALALLRARREPLAILAPILLQESHDHAQIVPCAEGRYPFRQLPLF